MYSCIHTGIIFPILFTLASPLYNCQSPLISPFHLNSKFLPVSGLVKVEPSTTGTVPVHIQCPCGLVKAMVDVDNGKSGKVKFTSVPAFAFAVDLKLPTKSFGEVTLDISYGGTFYALIADKELGLDIRNSDISELTAAAKEILEICCEKVTVNHPEEDDLAFMYGVIVTDGKDEFGKFKDEPSCNMCYFGDGQV